MIHTEGTDDLFRIARALKEAGDSGLKKRVSAAMRQEAKPLGERVLRAGAGKMPRRGGLSARISSRGRVLISNSLGGKSASVTLRLKTSDGYDLRGLDRGMVRHPVYGNRRTWVRQTVPANAFTDALQAEAPPFRQSILKAAQDTLNDVARSV